MSFVIAEPRNREIINSLLKKKISFHRHLDWREPVDWLGSKPFVCLQKEDQILAALACPVDPPGIAWVRLFACIETFSISDAWKLLFDDVLAYYGNGSTILAAVAIDDWFKQLLLTSDFHLHQEIVVMERNPQSLFARRETDPIEILPMLSKDLLQVEYVDHSAFSALWQLSNNGLVAAFNQSEYSTLAIVDNQVVGYQISTKNMFTAHLARIGVRKDCQGNGIGSALLWDAINYFSNSGYSSMTLNTQIDNPSSMALYRIFGFKPTGEDSLFLFIPHPHISRFIQMTHYSR